MQAYKDDLAYIHDVGYGDFAKNAAPELLAILRRRGLEDGLVVDLGCGSGLWAEELCGAGYDVLGVDISPAMIEIARCRAPQATFEVGSFLKVDLPRCGAVTSLGECLNYLFDEDKFTTYDFTNEPISPARCATRAFECGRCAVMDSTDSGRDTSAS